ncbi:MAG: hypothetical protein CL607_12335 [Anaerolineaceae bacterium]|nr:hypothetical protein [Anaerolineaceae bacterium]
MLQQTGTAIHRDQHSGNSLAKFVQWLGYVPLGIKILGIVLAAMMPPAFVLFLWFIDHASTENPTFLSLKWMLGVFIATLFGLVFARLLTNVFIQPIREIARVAQLVNDGKLNQRVIVKANDEIGYLGTTFNTMIDSLQHSHTALHDMNNHLTERNQELSILCDLASIRARSLIAEDAVNVGLKQVLEITGFDAGIISLVNEAETLVNRAHNNMPPDLLFDPDFLDLQEQLMVQARKDTEPHWVGVGAVATDAHMQAGFLESWGYRGLINVPILVEGDVRGLLTIFHKTPLADAPERLSLLSACKQLSITLENALLYQELRRKDAIRSRLLASAVAAQEQERERISRELHDETGQALTALLVQMKVFERLPNLDAVSAHASDMREIVVQTLDEVRRLARDLRPSTLDNLGLAPTLEWYIKACQQKYGLDISHQFTLAPSERLPRDIELILYRVAQEALTNIARHARANRAWIHLEQVGDLVRLRIEDDGCGFDVETTLNAHDRNLGLLGIQERVGLLGGKLHLESAPGQGTCLQVEVAAS